MYTLLLAKLYSMFFDSSSTSHTVVACSCFKLFFLTLIFLEFLNLRMDKYESFHADWESSEGPSNFDMEEHIRDTWSWFRDVLKSPKVLFSRNKYSKRV
jgi:hypothetical protein